MNERRRFLAGMLAAGVIPKTGWASAGMPAWLSAAGTSDGTFVLCGITAAREIAFRIPIPARGHAAAAHPTKAHAVAFARRPGTFALVIDCANGEVKSRLASPTGHHFYGHGAFSADGSVLFTSENDYGNARGMIGVWDATDSYRRITAFESGGIGPHDIKRLPGSDTLVVANGGIETHPDSGRTKLNLATMQPNLNYITDGQVTETVTLPRDLRLNSIRHLALSKTGTVAFGMQWEGSGHPRALVGLHKRGEDPLLGTAPDDAIRAMQGYVGSIAMDETGHRIAVTSPRGGLVQTYDGSTGNIIESYSQTDACGIASQGEDFTVTAGTGDITRLSQPASETRSIDGLMWDNHLVPVGT